MTDADNPPSMHGCFGDSAPGRTVIARGLVLLPDARLEERDVVLEDGRVRALEPPGSAATGVGRTVDTEIIDAAGCYVAPGFVDTHVHGGLGANFMSGGSAMATISRHLAAGGVTSCVAATASTSPDQLRKSLIGIANACGPVPDGIEVLGIHMEGPFLSPNFRGVHPAEHVRPPQLEELHAIWDASGEALRIVTMAPEVPGGLEALRFFASRAVSVSIGHSGATYEETRSTVAQGVSRATHLWNGLPPMHHRAAGPVLALLESPGVFVELVGDGRHVAAEMLSFTAHYAGRDRVVLVSDGTDVSGLPPGRHRRWEGTDVVLDEAGARTVATGGLAGSVISMGHAVRFLVECCGVPLEDALVMSSTTPARSVGADSKGLLAPGRDADVVVLKQDLSIERTIARGQTIFLKEVET